MRQTPVCRQRNDMTVTSEQNSLVCLMKSTSPGMNPCERTDGSDETLLTVRWMDRMKVLTTVN